MKEQILSIEQMKELESLGLDTSDSSCMWTSIQDKDYNPVNWLPVFRADKTPIEVLRKEFPLTYKEGNIYYCYTLTDILKKLPNTIKEYAGLQMWKDMYNEYHFQYICETPHLGNYYQSPDFDNTSILDAAFLMLKWCIKNKYI